MIKITEAAKLKIGEILSEENDPNLKLRMFVQGGGCAGFCYGFSLDSDQSEDDFVINCGTENILVDAMSIQYVQDSTIDYKDDLEGSRFSISNPQAQTTCGCGSSFSV